MHSKSEVQDAEKMWQLAIWTTIGKILHETIGDKIIFPFWHLHLIDRTSKQQIPWEKLEDMLRCQLTFDGRLSLLTSLCQMVQETITAGGCLAIRQPDSDNPLGFTIRLTEQSQINRNLNADPGNGNIIADGIEYDRDGVVAAFHFHDGDEPRIRLFKNRQRFSASDVAYYFVPEEPNHVFGSPWFSHLHDEIADLHRLNLEIYSYRDQQEMSKAYQHYQKRLAALADAAEGITYGELSGNFSRCLESVEKRGARSLWLAKRQDIFRKNVLMKMEKWILEGLEKRGLDSKGFVCKWSPPGP